MANETVTHYAKSIWVDVTFWTILVLGAFADPDIQQMLIALGVPTTWVSKGAIVAGLIARYKAKRPVAFIAPGSVTKVDVPKIPESKVA